MSEAILKTPYPLLLKMRSTDEQQCTWVLVRSVEPNDPATEEGPVFSQDTKWFTKPPKAQDSLSALKDTTGLREVKADFIIKLRMGEPEGKARLSP